MHGCFGVVIKHFELIHMFWCGPKMFNSSEKDMTTSGESWC